MEARLLREEHARLHSGFEPACAREIAEIAVALQAAEVEPMDLTGVLVDLCLHTQHAMSTLERRLETIGHTLPPRPSESS